MLLKASFHCEDEHTYNNTLKLALNTIKNNTTHLDTDGLYNLYLITLTIPIVLRHMVVCRITIVVLGLDVSS
jgi:hypothetical protein